MRSVAYWRRIVIEVTFVVTFDFLSCDLTIFYGEINIILRYPVLKFFLTKSFPKNHMQIKILMRLQKKFYPNVCCVAYCRSHILGYLHSGVMDNNLKNVIYIIRKWTDFPKAVLNKLNCFTHQQKLKRLKWHP